MQEIETQNKKPDLLKGITTLALSGLAIYGTYRLLTDGKKYLKHNNINSKNIKKATIDLFISESNEADLYKRLHRIGILIRSNDPIDREAGALLYCSTYESTIRDFCIKNLIVKEDHKDSIYHLAKKLLSLNYISKNDFINIKKFVNEFRNKVMHGYFSEVDLELIKKLKVLR